MVRYLFLIVLNTLFILLPRTISHDSIPIPKEKAQVQRWFKENVKPLKARKGTLDPALEAAEANPRIIKVMKKGGGDFTTITEAVRSIPPKNDKRVIVYIGPGEYPEKIKMERDKKFVTFLGDPDDMPTLVYHGNAAAYTIVESGTLTVDGDYFVAANLHIKNSSPRPDGKIKGGQAAAMRIGGDMAAFYNVRFYGFQDTFCDDRGRHFFKDCYIEGTADFIFGNAKSIYLNTEIHCISGELESWITAHARSMDESETGYVFVHCPVTGIGQGWYLGRAWKGYSKVVFAYSQLGPIVGPKGWSSNSQPAPNKNLYFAEYSNTGQGSDTVGRERFVKKLSLEQAKPFLCLSYIEGSKWLLPPPKVPKVLRI
ncbi:pectinesterase 2 [Artemisia annua]|uniref:pectinesterase n=1 Tax=Artemisia annua TaxID=35608 RepID=A0A2U1M1F6_ARTAN|nr:pectinesterase 2 [Artemisia annua]